MGNTVVHMHPVSDNGILSVADIGDQLWKKFQLWQPKHTVYICQYIALLLGLVSWGHGISGAWGPWCLLPIKTQLHNSKTFLRRKIEKESLWYDTEFCICNKGVYLYVWILCVLVRWRPVSGMVSSQRDLPLSPAQKRQAKNLASYPGSLGEGEKRAWYLLFAHALN